MALVKYGGGIVQMSGSMAGNTYARNHYGNYVRARTKPTNPNSSRQQSVRAAIAWLTDRWAQTLTAAQRTAWDLYAKNVVMKNKLGEATKLTGFNHYIRSNSVRKRIGAGIIDEGPVVFELPEKDPTFNCTASEATQQISITFDTTLDWSSETTAVMLVEQGQPQNAQRVFFAGPWRHMTQIYGIDPGGAVSPDLAAVQFAIAEGQHLWIYARISRTDGRLSERFRADCFCAA